jgi:F-type H+-transporting ATPase subunit a
LGLPITNTMVMTWGMTAALVLVVRWVMGGKPSLVPTRGQLVLEAFVEQLQALAQPILGKALLRDAFPLLFALFVYILMHNWSALIPGVGTVGRYDAQGHLLYFLRPANADLNTTLGLALVAMTAWAYWVLRYEGLKGFIAHTFGNKADKREVPALLYGFLFVVFFLVGLIECISILFRLVSLSFRLYGNVFGGENLLGAMQSVMRFGLPIPFYCLEFLIGAIQAFVFILLVTVYLGLACPPPDSAEHEAA